MVSAMFPSLQFFKWDLPYFLNTWLSLFSPNLCVNLCCKYIKIAQRTYFLHLYNIPRVTLLCVKETTEKLAVKLYRKKQCVTLNDEELTTHNLSPPLCSHWELSVQSALAQVFLDLEGGGYEQKLAHFFWLYQLVQIKNIILPHKLYLTKQFLKQEE